ncbi:hypothetical protein PanWU01x14_125970 [Parasponia andersonii]|uniref:Uncharacterized protein n=1 Tax=Parasponia andersonii TaxID=3476 RepID=A0A2P5CTB7_PARAD|nr:hypothetical protein PanWU01x14_125970 [Parasponia andersonii]
MALYWTLLESMVHVAAPVHHVAGDHCAAAGRFHDGADTAAGGVGRRDGAEVTLPLEQLLDGYVNGENGVTGHVCHGDGDAADDLVGGDVGHRCLAAAPMDLLVCDGGLGLPLAIAMV